MYDETSYRYNNRYLEIQSEKIKYLLKEFRLNSKMLVDLGCGTCILRSFIREDIYYIGIDLSINMLKEYKGFKKNTSLIQADIEHLPLKKDSLNTIFLLTVIQNLTKIQSWIKEIDQISKNQSLLFISLLKKDENLSDFKENLKKNMFVLQKKLDIKGLEDYLLIFKKIN
ncbi:MAG: class I SAM-dependent methyltransferase [Candidatus Lokiarchaeota archaeon]|nr:class I SAM-dependent methyltransferase [Candidatus Lokiarchaeota archaeon]